MPHVHIQHFAPALPEDVLSELSAVLAATLGAFFGCEERVVSIAVEPVFPGEWASRVYEPVIAAQQQWLVKPPGYGRLHGEPA
ncbi:MAG TPA: hypothetical protein VF503_01545 [Sphingobium sp.]|uniref:hypothetical protein n=1 Tax=Sphingobium sp. TaxID=1912891 RepID=UPI002ED2F0B5